MIEVRGLTKRFGGKVAVADLSFDVRPGVVTGFLGPNGSGKSTTMRCMIALDRPQAGATTFSGQPYQSFAQPLREVGALFDAGYVHPGRSARNHLRWLAASNGLAPQRIDETLDMVGLSSVAHRQLRTFSLGMRQRLGLAGVLLGDPHTVMLDEPANGLDPDGIRWLRTMLTSFAADGGTVFVSSHFIAELANFANDLVVVGDGRLVTAEPLTETLARDRALSLEDIVLDLTRGAARFAAA